MNSKWRKILRDLSLNKMRSFLVIIAITIGVFGISVVANSYSILQREMNKNYMNTTPASSTLWTEPLSDADIEDIRSLSYIKDAEERESITARVQIGPNEWKDILLFVIHDFNDMRLDTFFPESGKTVPDYGEILFERKALSFANTSIGKSVDLKLPNGPVTSLNLTGSVHAPGLPPAWMDGIAFGFITRDTYKLLGGIENQTELKILVSGDQMDKKNIRDATYQLKQYLEDKGTQVSKINIPEPGKHPHYSQMATLLYLMETFGFIALLLSGVLVANMISSILEQQTRQIGIMKSIGASSKQIAGLYFGMVTLLSIVALLIGIPLGIYAGRGYASLTALILNFNIYSDKIPLYIYLLELVIGLFVPLLVSLLPIRKGSKITVREAIQDYGIDQAKYSGKSAGKTAKLLTPLPRPFLLSLRNTFRRRGRLIFTLMVMAIGGTGFIVAMNIFSSMYNTVDQKMNAFSYNIQVTFEQPQPLDKVENSISSILGVKMVEAWGGAFASRVYEDNTTSNSFPLIAPTSDTKLMTTPPLYSGRWLKPEDTNCIVLNQQLLTQEADIKIGDQIVLRINKKDTTWNVIGISKELIGKPTAYVNLSYLSQLTGQDGYANNAVIATKDQGIDAEAEVAKNLEQELSKDEMPLSSLIKLSNTRKSLEDHLVVIASFLVAMSMLVVLVGGLGLATTISINTLERTREIGIMRATGAPTTYITGMIMCEGIIIGILSWFISTLLSWPLSKFISNRFGLTFFEVPLEFAASTRGYIIWLAIVIVFAALASYYPSRKASKMQVRDALTYE